MIVKCSFCEKEINKDLWQVNFKRKYIGTFNNINDAINARKEAENNY